MDLIFSSQAFKSLRRVFLCDILFTKNVFIPAVNFVQFVTYGRIKQTPTMHGIRTDRYKYIRCHGIWDTNEFYDLKEDPNEMNNLIASPKHQELIKQLSDEVYNWLKSTNGMQIPLKKTSTRGGDHRNKKIF